MSARLTFPVLLFAPFLLVSFAWPDWNALLSDEDIERAEADAIAGSELSGPEWESYNEWNCFPAADAALECTESDEDGSRVPTLRVKDRDQTIDFSMDPDPDLDCGAVLTEWESLLKNEGGFCAYAAFLQELEPDGEFIHRLPWSLWIVSGIKTSKGYWP